MGYGVLRVTRDQRWKPFYIGNPVYNLILQLFFEYGIAAQHLELGKVAKGRVDQQSSNASADEGSRRWASRSPRTTWSYPALTGPAWRSTLSANFVANMIRNVWTNAVIFCGHFPDGAEKFTKEDIDERDARASGTCGRCWAARTSPAGRSWTS